MVSKNHLPFTLISRAICLGTIPPSGHFTVSFTRLSVSLQPEESDMKEKLGDLGPRPSQTKIPPQMLFLVLSAH